MYPWDACFFAWAVRVCYEDSKCTSAGPLSSSFPPFGWITGTPNRSRPMWVFLTPRHQNLSGPSNCPSNYASQKLRAILVSSCFLAIYLSCLQDLNISQPVSFPFHPSSTGINPAEPSSELISLLPKNNPSWAHVLSPCLEFFCGSGHTLPPGLPLTCVQHHRLCPSPLSVPSTCHVLRPQGLCTCCSLCLDAFPSFFTYLTSCHSSYLSTDTTSSGKPSLTWLPSSVTGGPITGWFSLSSWS